jgi:hypothetical protein
MSYTIYFTDKTKTPITIDDGDIDTSTPITMFGRTRLMYGQELQDNLLQILENYSCPENPNQPGTPYVQGSSGNMFTTAIEGMFWYNETQNVLNYYDGTNWNPIAAQDSVAANWGIISDGEYLPNPVSEVTGKVFPYSQCAYIVAPFSFPQQISYMVCEASDAGLVTMQYILDGTSNVVSGMANYLIVGINGNVNHQPVQVSPTPTPTVTPTTSVGNSATPTPTVTRSATPAPTHSPTPTPGPTNSPTPTPSKTPIPSPTPSTTPTLPAVNPLPFNGGTFSAVAQGVEMDEPYYAIISMSFTSNGAYNVYNNNGQTLATGTWLPSGWSAGNTDMMMAYSTTGSGGIGGVTVSNTCPTYTAMSNGSSFSAEIEGENNLIGSATVSLTIYIKNASTGQFSTTSCTLSLRLIPLN